ncbi:MAG: hypothetical protein EBV45_03460, partial [Chloroflexi bacterium]|nr:hypothetical protein [Chloroflexota bacterium]
PDHEGRSRLQTTSLTDPSAQASLLVSRAITSLQLCLGPDETTPDFTCPGGAPRVEVPTG